jgi:DNA-binding protein H-NS
VAFGYEKISEACGGSRTREFSRADGTSLDRGCVVVSAQNHENVMSKLNLAIMQVEELWQLYEELVNVLADKISAEKGALEDRLARLNSFEIVREIGISPSQSLSSTDRALRPKYPKVPPKYRNPLAPSEKWSGRGKRPKWVTAALEAGQRLDDLKIEPAQRSSRKSRPRGRRT